MIRDICKDVVFLARKSEPAGPEDLITLEKNREREKKAMAVCQQKIAEHGLDMKLVDVEYTFDNSKILFYFTADGRVELGGCRWDGA